MSNTTTTATVNELKSGLKGLRNAILYAHNANNAHALTKNECQGAGCSTSDFTLWESYCRRLYDVCCENIKLTEVKTATQAQHKAADEAVWLIWKQVLATVDNGKFVDGSGKWHNNMFVLKTDLKHLLGYVDDFQATNKGTQFAFKSLNKFRCDVEAMIGARICANGYLTNEQREIIINYRAAVNSRESAELKLCDILMSGAEVNYRENLALGDKGIIIKNSEIKVPSISRQVDEAKEKLEDLKSKLATELNATEEQIRVFTSALAGEVKKLEDAEKSVLGNLDNAKNKIAELEPAYTAIMDSLNTEYPDVAQKM